MMGECAGSIINAMASSPRSSSPQLHAALLPSLASEVDVAASRVVYKHGAVGAVRRTAAEVFGDLVSVKDFGAVGDGVVDDSDAIQAALDTGAPVYFPRGTYLHTAGLKLTADGQTVFGLGGTSILNYAGIEIGIDFNGMDHCVLRDMQVRSPRAARAIRVGPIAHWAKVTGCDIRGSSSGSDLSGAICSGVGIDVERSFYVEIAGNDISRFAAGIYGHDECNGNFFMMNSIRDCHRGVHVTDTMGNSDGNIISSNEIEGGVKGNLYAIDIQGCSNMVVSGNRLEYSPFGEAHIYVHEGVGQALRHDIRDNHCVGSINAVKLGDGFGSHDVQSCRLSGGYYAMHVTVGVDCDYTDVDLTSRSFGGPGLLMDESMSTILTWYTDQSIFVELTGVLDPPTAGWLASCAKNAVTVYSTELVGESISASCTITGIPELLRPQNSQTFPCRVYNGGSRVASFGTIDSSGTITLSADQGGGPGFNNSGTKGWSACTVTYPRR